MTHRPLMDKDRLAAFVDGELSPEEAAAVVMHLADHPQDQAYVDDLMAANEALSQAFAAPLDEPVPPAMRDLILGTPPPPAGSVVPFPARSGLRARVLTLGGGLVAGAALAAGLAVAVFLPTVDAHDLMPGPLAASGPLHAALSTLTAGTVQVMEDGAEVMILASMPTPAGFCREIEVIHPEAGRLEAALACTSGAGWAVEVVIAADLADTTAPEGFETASGDEVQGFAPFLDRIGAGAVMAPDDEAAAIARGWAR